MKSKQLEALGKRLAVITPKKLGRMLDRTIKVTDGDEFAAMILSLAMAHRFTIRATDADSNLKLDDILVDLHEVILTMSRIGEIMSVISKGDAE